MRVLSLSIQQLFNMSRTFFVGGNWKMNGSVSKTQELINGLKGAQLDPKTGMLSYCKTYTQRW